MAREDENRGFTCINCGANVCALTNGSYRNHCPMCLCSLHVDTMPGNRESRCRGIMRAVALAYRSETGWQLIHRCERCGAHAANRIAESTVQPDDVHSVARLSGLGIEKSGRQPTSRRR